MIHLALFSSQWFWFAQVLLFISIWLKMIHLWIAWIFDGNIDLYNWMMLMVSSNDLLSLFVSIELQSLALYILVLFSREDLIIWSRCKILVQGVFHLHFPFWFEFNLWISWLNKFLRNKSIYVQSIFRTFNVNSWLIFILVSLSLKISGPFHMWTSMHIKDPHPLLLFFITAPVDCWCFDGSLFIPWRNNCRLKY